MSGWGSAGDPPDRPAGFFGAVGHVARIGMDVGAPGSEFTTLHPVMVEAGRYVVGQAVVLPTPMMTADEVDAAINELLVRFGVLTGRNPMGRVTPLEHYAEHVARRAWQQPR